MTAPQGCLPPRVNEWQLRTRILRFGRVPCIMGIVNVTPDSFSDGGQHREPAAAVDHALQLIEQGAQILDIGGESTRPYSHSISVSEELHRVLPVIERLTDATEVPLSIDTSKAEVAREALARGVEIVNDVTGLEGDPRMLATVLDEAPGVCLMHMQGTPATMQDNPQYQDVVGEVRTYLQQRARYVMEQGLTGSRICLDPGIGFGKSHQHNLMLVANCWQFHGLQQPLLVGHSRKGFIAKLVGIEPIQRAAGTVGVAVALASQGVQILRVHDVAAVSAAMRMFDAAGGLDGAPGELGE